MSKAGETATFTYNADGLRVKKVCTTTGTTNYTLHGKNVVHLSNGSNNLHFFYDAQNRPAVVVFNGIAYGYVHNLQGDIIAIVNSAGTKVVEYAYDAWGKPLSKIGSMASTLGTLNPFRYHGYVYDEETGLYYLQSRYYSLYFMRFINADILYETNLFTYCKNNPANNTDNSGYACVTCFDENGNLNSFLSTVMGGDSGGCGGAIGGHTMIETVRHMDKEDWINEAKTIAVICLSLSSSGLIMKGAHLLGKAFLAESIAYGSGKAVGYALYASSVANGLVLSYAADSVIRSAADMEVKPITKEDFFVDLVVEFLPLKAPTSVDFAVNYMEESIERDLIQPMRK